MSLVRRIAKNTSALFIAQVVSSSVSLIFGVIIARILGDTIFGKFAFALAFTDIFSIFISLGYNTLLIRDVSRDKTLVNKYMNNIFGFRVIFSFILFVLIVVMINIMQYPDDTKIAVYLLGIFQILEALANVFKTTFRAFERMEFEALVIVSVNLLSLPIMFGIIYLGYGLIAVSLVYVAIGLMDFLFSVILCGKKIAWVKRGFDLNFFRKTFPTAVSLSMLAIFALIYVKIDTVMLSVMKGDAVVGWYNAAYYLVQGFKPLQQMVMSALFPIMSFSYVSSKDALKRIFETAFKFLFIVGLPMAVGITILADKFIFLIYGSDFQNSIIALQILSWDVLLVFLYGCISFLLVSINRQYQMALFAGCTAVINIVMNLLLIPTYSYVGSAFATIIAESFLLVAYLLLSAKYFHMLPLHRMIIKPILACSLMGMFVYYFNDVHLAVVIPLAVVIYFSALFLLKGFSKDDLSMIKSLFKKEKSS